MKRIVGVLAAAAAASFAPSAGAATTCPGADTPISAATLASARSAVLCIVNAERSARGMATLQRNALLETAAQLHTDDMVAKRYFGHVSPGTNADPGARLTSAGYAWWQYGENIAVGQDTPRAVMAAWLKSPGHCENIFAPGVTQLGIGVAAVPSVYPDQDGGTWTQEFGRPAGTAAPSRDSSVADGCAGNGYSSFAGLDPAPQTAAADPGTATPGTSTPGTAAPGTSVPGASAPSNPTPVGRTPGPGGPDTGSPAQRLRVGVVRRSGRLVVVGRILDSASAQRSRVLIALRSASGQIVARRRTRLTAGGLFAARLPRSVEGLTLVVSVRGLRFTRPLR